MENNGTVTEVKTLGNFLEGKAPGTPIYSDLYPVAYWTGEFTVIGGVQHAVLIDTIRSDTSSAVRYLSLNDPSRWTVYERHQPATGELLSAIIVAAKARSALQAAKNANIRLSSEQAKYKETIRETLIEWFDGNLDEDDSGDSFDELLENLGLGARVKKYTVTGCVTYSFEFEVEASSENEARESVESDFGEFAGDLDTYYPDSVDVDSVDIQ